MSLLTEFKQPYKETEETEPVVRMEGVSVRYRVAQERIPSFKEYIIRRIKGQIQYQDFWALHDINMEVHRGEVFGIIGPNGAGKSTLLKVVARVLRPTKGRVRVRGRVAPLLELGAGFDQELTGRENIYLNGTILGFSQQEMETYLDSIVEFSGLHEFIDQPLRTYSTGMIARLGFSVATVKRPEILIVDEILGVGDAEFQTKSYERIQKFKGEGTTILLVTHSLNHIKEMCSRVMWLDHGHIMGEGSPSGVVNQYQAKNAQSESQRLIEQSGSEIKRRWGTHKLEITGVRITGTNGKEQSIFHSGQRLTLQISYLAHEPIPGPVFGIAIHRQDGVHITGPNTKNADLPLPTLEGSGTITYTVPSLPLLEGLYEISVAAVNQDDTEMFDYHDRQYPFRVLPDDGQMREQYGIMTLNGQWEHQSK